MKKNPLYKIICKVVYFTTNNLGDQYQNEYTILKRKTLPLLGYNYYEEMNYSGYEGMVAKFNTFDEARIAIKRDIKIRQDKRYNRSRKVYSI